MEKPSIVRKPVKSSNVKSVGYDAASKTLSVEFSSGGVYHYHDVPEAIGNGVGAADSVGGFLNKHVKGKFAHTS